MAVQRLDEEAIFHVARKIDAVELVKGVPITEFCDHNQPSVRQRLEPFVGVCRALRQTAAAFADFVAHWFGTFGGCVPPAGQS
jgi:hypothetical protein